MVEHRMDCRQCGIEVVVDSFMEDHKCPECGESMGIVAAVSGLDGDYHHTSDSLAIHPDDIPAHRKLYPGVDVTSEGQPKFTSPKQQEEYAKKSAGCYKKPQKTKSRLGKTRIA